MSLSKAEREAGYQMAPTPSDHTTAILRRAARGFINITLTKDGPLYAYDDGGPVLDAAGRALSSRSFNHMVKEGWLLPVEGGSFLTDGPPQQYRARRISDGKRPRIFQR